MDEKQYLSILGRMFAINAEIEAAKVYNRTRNFTDEDKYNHDWFYSKSRELVDLSNEAYRF